MLKTGRGKFEFIDSSFYIASASILVLIISVLPVTVSGYSGFQTPVLNSAPQTNDTTNDLTIVDDKSLRNIIQESENLYQLDRKTAEFLIRKGFDYINHNKIEDSVLASAYHLMGKILISKHENQAGIDTLTKCITLKKQIFGEHDERLAKTYNLIGIGYFQLHDYEKAILYYNRSGAILKKNNLFNQSLYDIQLNIGIVNAVLGRFDSAYRYFNAARMVLDSLGNSVDSVLIARFYHNYGALTTFMGKLEEANSYYTISQSIYEQKFGPDYKSLAGINNNKGTNAYHNYDYSKAELFYQNALDIYLINENLKAGVPRAYLNLSAVCLKKGDFKKAIQFAESGLDYEPDDDLKIILYQNLATSLKKQDKLSEADHYFQEALSLVKNKEVNPSRSVSLYKAYADFLFENGSFPESKKYYDAAIIQSINLDGDRSILYAILQAKIGDYFRLYINDTDSALDYYNKSIVNWRRILLIDQDSIRPENFNEIRFIDAYIGKAITLFNQFQETGNTNLLRQSFSIYEWLLSRLEEISNNLDRDNRLILSEEIRNAYNQAVEVAWQLYLLEKEDKYREAAFSFAEKSKSAVLLALVQNVKALKTTDVPQEVLKLEQQLTSEINGLRKLLVDEQKNEKPSDQKISFFNKRLLNLLLKHDSLIAAIEKDHPKYYSLKYDKTVISTNELREYLKEDEAVLEYVLADSALFLFAIRKDLIKMEKIKIGLDFFNALDKMIHLKNLDLASQSNADLKGFAYHSHLLWDYLIAPVYNVIHGKRLLIIPDGLLGYLPFDLLLKSDEIPESNFYNRLPYLIKEFPVSYSYSSSLRYNSYFNNKKKPDRSLIAFAPEYETMGNQQISSEINFTELPQAVQEIEQIREIIGGESYIGKNATKKNFLNNATGNQVIHLAMHTIINDSMPMLSQMVFYNNKTTEDDYLLRTYEIFGLNLNAEMVTLSACNTGSGKLQKGEGIMSLARGFIYSGVPAIVITLWEVQDQSGSEIMSRYYENIRNGDRKDVALQKAKLSFLSEANQIKAHPFHWSSYIVSGDTKPISLKQSGKGTTMFVLGLIFAILLFLFITKKQRKYP